MRPVCPVQMDCLCKTCLHKVYLIQRGEAEAKLQVLLQHLPHAGGGDAVQHGHQAQLHEQAPVEHELQAVPDGP